MNERLHFLSLDTILSEDSRSEGQKTRKLEKAGNRGIIAIADE